MGIMRALLLLFLNVIQCTRVVMLLWLLLGVPLAASASLPPDPLRPERVASDEPSNLFGSDFTFVAPGMFDKPLALMDAAPDGQHGRALSECVSAAPTTHHFVAAAASTPL